MNILKRIFQGFLKFNYIENFILISSTVIFIILIVIDYTLLKDPNAKISGYICNIATEFLGIIITYFVIQRLFNKQNIDKEKQEEREKILRYHEIISIYISHYKRYFYCITTPIEKRDFQNIILNSSFKLSDMCDIHKPTLLITVPPYKPAIELFYEKELELRNIFENIVMNIDFKYYIELQTIIKEFIKVSLFCDVKDSIVSNKDMKLGAKKIIEEVCEIFKSDYIEEHYTQYKQNSLGANIATPYFVLFDLLKNESIFIERYETLINEMKS